MTITHKIVDKVDPIQPGGSEDGNTAGSDIISQLNGLIGQAKALVSANVGISAIQGIGSQIAGMGTAITGAGGSNDIAGAITGLGTQMATMQMNGMAGLLSSLTSQMSGLTSLLNPKGSNQQVLHSHILDKLKGIAHSAFQGKHTVELKDSGIDLTSANKVATSAPIIPHNGNTTVSDSLAVTLGITGQSFGMISDERLKSNIEQHEPVLDKVMSLNLKRFDIKTIDWEFQKIHPSAPRPSIGLIAQDVQKIFPGLVSGDKFLTLEEGKIGLLVLAAFQEFVIEVRKEIAELKK